MNNLEAALSFVKQYGTPVFPVLTKKTDKANAKSPYWKGSFGKASSDPDRIRQMWEECRGECAFATYPGAKGYAVVDIDRHNGGADGESSLFDWELNNGMLPSTFTVTTPSGGKHLWFKSNELTGGKDGLLPGVDVHGGPGSEGRYVLLPGQTISTGSYDVKEQSELSDLPSPMATAVNDARKSKPSPRETTGTDGSWTDFSSILEEIREMDPLPCGRRDNSLFALCASWKERGVSYSGMVELMKTADSLGKIDRGEDPLTDDDFCRIARSCWSNKGIPYGTDTVSALLSTGLEETGAKEEDQEYKDTKALPIESLGKFRATPPEPRHSLIEGFMAHGRYLTLIYGRGGSGKSLVVQQMLRELVRKRDFLGLKPGDACSGLRPLLLSCEEPEEDVHYRYYKQSQRIDPEGVGREPMWCNLRGKESYLFRRSRSGMEATELFHSLVRRCKTLGVNLLVIDSLSRIFPGNEIDRNDVTYFGKAIDTLCIETGCHVIVLAHTNKEGGFSGSSAWEAICRQMYIIKGESVGGESVGGECLYTMTVEKTNEGKRGASVSYRFDDWYFRAISEEDRAVMAQEAQKRKVESKERAREDAAGNALPIAIDILNENGGCMTQKELTASLNECGFNQEIARRALVLGVDLGDLRKSKGERDSNGHYPTLVALNDKLISGV